MFPNMLIFLVYVMVCMSNHILLTSKQRKFYNWSTGLKEDNWDILEIWCERIYIVINLIWYTFVMNRECYYLCSLTFWCPFDTGDSMFLVLHTKPLKNRYTGSQSVVLYKILSVFFTWYLKYEYAMLHSNVLIFWQIMFIWEIFISTHHWYDNQNLPDNNEERMMKQAEDCTNAIVVGTSIIQFLL